MHSLQTRRIWRGFALAGRLGLSPAGTSRSISAGLQLHRALAQGATETMQTCQQSEYVQTQVGPSTIELGVGQPSPRLLPLAEIAAAAQHRFASADTDPLLLQYPTNPGYLSFRRALAEFLSDGYGVEVKPEELLATTGVSHSLDLCFRYLAQPGDTVLVETPTYFLARNILESCHLRPRGVPTDQGGLDTAQLEHMLRQEGIRPRLLYIIPVHHNPLGVTLSSERRAHLLALAHEFEFTIVVDEVYQLLTFPGAGDDTPLPPTLRALDTQEPQRVVSVGSFSKITAPGTRVGWIYAHPSALKLILKDGAVISGGCMAGMSQGIMHSALQLGHVQRHLSTTVLPALSQQASALVEALTAHLPPSCSFTPPRGGYFVWVRLPQGVDGKALLAHARRQHLVGFAPGAVCHGPPNTMRLCFAFYTPDELREGARRLGEALRSFQQLPEGEKLQDVAVVASGAVKPLI